MTQKKSHAIPRGMNMTSSFLCHHLHTRQFLFSARFPDHKTSFTRNKASSKFKRGPHELRDQPPRIVGHIHIDDGRRFPAFNAPRRRNQPLPFRCAEIIDAHLLRHGQMVNLIGRDGQRKIGEREGHSAHYAAVRIAVVFRKRHAAYTAVFAEHVDLHAVRCREPVAFK